MRTKELKEMIYSQEPLLDSQLRFRRVRLKDFLILIEDLDQT